MGHRLETSEQRTGRRTDADLCSLRRTKQEQVGGAAGRTRTILEAARASSKPCNGKLWSRKQRARTEREAPKSVRQHFVLSTRDPPFFFVLPFFYSSKRGRSEFNSSPTKSNRLDPRMYLIRPYALLGARVCVEPVPTPWCSNSSRGRFSSRQRKIIHFWFYGSYLSRG